MTRPTSPTIERRPRHPPRRSARGEDSRAGFALVEMMLALAIVALLAALALPWARPFDGGTALRTKAYEAAALLRADRDAAHRTNRTVETVIDAGRRGLRSGATRDMVLMPDAIALGWAGEGGRGILFHPDGRATGGVLALRAGRRTIRLEVDGFTSAVALRAPEQGAP